MDRNCCPRFSRDSPVYKVSLMRSDILKSDSDAPQASCRRPASSGAAEGAELRGKTDAWYTNRGTQCVGRNIQMLLQPPPSLPYPPPPPPISHLMCGGCWDSHAKMNNNRLLVTTEHEHTRRLSLFLPFRHLQSHLLPP